MIKYKIIEVDPTQHSIVVRYYTDTVTEEMLAIDILDGVVRRGRTDYSLNLPIPTPTHEALHDIIVSSAPTAWLHMQEDVSNPDIDTSMESLTPLVGQEVTIFETAI